MRRKIQANVATSQFNLEVVPFFQHLVALEAASSQCGVQVLRGRKGASKVGCCSPTPLTFWRFEFS